MKTKKYREKSLFVEAGKPVRWLDLIRIYIEKGGWLGERLVDFYLWKWEERTRKKSRQGGRKRDV